MTRLKQIGGTEVIVTRRGECYRLARIGEANHVEVAGQLPQGALEVALSNGVRIDVDGTRCQFFDPAADPQAPPGSATVDQGSGSVRATDPTGPEPRRRTSGMTT